MMALFQKFGNQATLLEYIWNGPSLFSGIEKTLYQPLYPVPSPQLTSIFHIILGTTYATVFNTPHHCRIYRSFIMSSSQNNNRNTVINTSRSKPQTYQCLVWSCCNCGVQGNMDFAVTRSCVGYDCQHRKCDGCHSEWIERLVNEPDYGGTWRSYIFRERLMLYLVLKI